MGIMAGLLRAARPEPSPQGSSLRQHVCVSAPGPLAHRQGHAPRKSLILQGNQRSRTSYFERCEWSSCTSQTARTSMLLGRERQRRWTTASEYPDGTKTNLDQHPELARFRSPTLLVDGRDVSADPAQGSSSDSCCRIYPESDIRVVAASSGLVAAVRGCARGGYLEGATNRASSSRSSRRHAKLHPLGRHLGYAAMSWSIV